MFVSPDEEEALFSSLEPWNPSVHAFEAEVIEYTPHKILHYRQEKDWLGALVTVLFVILISWLGGILFGHVKVWVVTTSSIAGFYLLVLWKMGEFSPVDWRFLFEEDCLFVKAGEEEFRYPLNEVKEVWFKLDVREQWWTSSLSGSHHRYKYASYNGQTMLAGLLEDSKLVVGSTGFLQRDPQEVDFMGMCFAWMLAETLGVPLRIEETALLEPKQEA